MQDSLEIKQRFEKHELNCEKLKLNFEKKLKPNLRKTQKLPTQVEMIFQKSFQKKALSLLT